MSEIFTPEKREQIRQKYCKDSGYSYFNNAARSDYSDYLELRLMQEQANDLTTVEKQCNLPVVVQQRELLIGFFDWWMKNSGDFDFGDSNEDVVNVYLANL